MHWSEDHIKNKVICTPFICDCRPLKAALCRVHILVSGDHFDYCKDTGLPAANSLATKLILNNIMSDTRTREHVV